MLFLTASGIKVALSLMPERWPQISTWWEEGKWRSLGSKKLVRHSSDAALEPEM